MKNILKISVIIFLILASVGWFYWQQHKKGILKNSIQNAVSNGTNNLYFIHYDSSSIDEVNGNASFYNIDLQSDSLQRQLEKYDTASSAVLFNIHIEEVSVRGADIPSLISNTSVEAKSIIIRKPVICIINSGKKREKLLDSNDSTAIYEKLLGKFQSIHAGEIIIENGSIQISYKSGQPHTSLNDISVQLKNFRIDSTRDYQNVLSYFIKGLIAKVGTIYLNGGNNQTFFTDVEYNAPGKFIRLKNFQQKNNLQQVVFDVNNTTINEINTDSFILKQQLRAEELISEGGMLTFYLKQKKDIKAVRDEIEIDNNYFNEALLNKVNIGNTKVLIFNKSEPSLAPIIIKNVKFSASDIQKLYSGTSIRNLISRSNWLLSADGFSFLSGNKKYKVVIGSFDINNINSSMRIKEFAVIPQLSESLFAKSIRYQEDLFDIAIRKIELTGINTKVLISERRLEAEFASLQPILKVFNDRTVPFNTASKVGKYPQQLLQKLPFPIRIKQIKIVNGFVAYKEKGAISEKFGTVIFKNINGTMSNVTNVKEAIHINNILKLNASALFMGVCEFQTIWKLNLNSLGGAFQVSGIAGGFNAEALNSITEPLGMVSIRKGRVNKITFDLTGNDDMAKGNSLLLYDNLKIDLLKKDSLDTRKKGLMSFVANVLIKDQNPSKGEIRKNDIFQERDKTKSFFYLVWKSIFLAAKKTVSGKNTSELNL